MKLVDTLELSSPVSIFKQFNLFSNGQGRPGDSERPGYLMISMHHAMIFPTVDVEWSGEMDILLRKITQHAVCIGHHVLFPTTLAGCFYKRVEALSERGHQLSTRELPTSATIQLNLLPTPVPEIDCLCGVDGRWAISVTPVVLLQEPLPTVFQGPELTSLASKGLLLML